MPMPAGPGSFHRAVPRLVGDRSVLAEVAGPVGIELTETAVVALFVKGGTSSKCAWRQARTKGSPSR